MEPIGPDDKTGPFSRSNEPRSGRQNLSCEIGWSQRANCPIVKVKLATERANFQGQIILGAGFQTSFLPNYSWTSVKTLDMEPIGPDEKTGPFSRSKDPRSG
ncbi:hypothetical protein KY285_009109 [Solanum tuberosum]|nr:hypothetical protein KY285_009109 [Solanum tuberosum]